MTGIEIAAIAASAIGSGAQAAGAAKANKRGVKFAEKENAMQRQFQIDQWNRQNEYNDPKQQMERLKAAGINPHFYMGGSPQNQAAPTPSAGGGVMPNIKPVDPGIQQVGQTMLQAEMMKAQIENIKADTAKKSEETTGITLTNGITTQTLANTPTTINLDNQTKSQNVELLKANTENAKQEIINKISSNDEIRQRIDNLITTNAYTEQQTANLVTSMALTQAQLQTESFKQRNIAADTKLKAAEENFKRESAKTQSHVRSNLSANTGQQNAITKNLGKQWEILEEDRKQKNRNNFIGEKLDFTDRLNNKNTSENQLSVIKQTYQNLMKDEQFKSLKIEEQEFINMNMGIDTMLRPITETVKMKNATNTSTTTTRYNRNGQYRGNTTTRRHR